MGVADLGTDQVGIGCPDIGGDIFGGFAIGPDIQVRDICPNTPYAEGDGIISP